MRAVVLQNLALLQRTRSVLEIGVFTGTATLALGLILRCKSARFCRTTAS
jgi:predicted O-methyltransferase YrrM